MILEPESAFLIHMKIFDLRVTFGQPPLDVCDSLIAAMISPLSNGVRVTLY
jgi:hypothetical protein